MRTVYNYDCSVTRTSTASTSTTLRSTSTTSDISPRPTSVADPNPGIASLPKADSGEPAAFFATSAGKGTIAGVSIASTALTVLLVCLVLWRRKQNRDSGVIKVGEGKASFFGLGRSRGSARSSTSSFGVSSDSLVGVAYDDRVPESDPRLAAERQEMTETLAAGGGAGRSFFVESRNRSAQPSSHGHGSNEAGYSGSSNGHDPFAEPSSSGHSHSQEGYLTAGCAVGSQRRHERKQSGYTADTYRRKSRPVSLPISKLPFSN